MGLVPENDWIHFTIGIAGTVIMIYAFTARFFKERMLLSEVMTATIIGVLIGKPLGGLLTPERFGKIDTRYSVLQEVSRLVLAIQLVSAALGLPVRYMERNWKPLAVLLCPVTLFTWAISFGITAACFHHKGLLNCLLISACLTPTDPVLASTILQGNFAEKHLPHSLRALLQAESGANDGTALPLVVLPILLMQESSTGEAMGKWFYEVWLYQVVLAIVVGFLYGTFAWALKYIGTRWDLIDEPSYLAHVIGLALGSVGLLRSIGSGEVLSVFCSSISFSSKEPTQEEGKYDAINGIELIVTITYFMYFGAILPTEAWTDLGLIRLFIFSIGVIFIRRLPVLLLFAPWIKPLRAHPGGKKVMYAQAAFAGFYGPIGVGALFYAALAQEKLKDELTFHIISFTVLCSVAIYGLSAAPLSKMLYMTMKAGRKAAARLHQLPEDSGSEPGEEGLEDEEEERRRHSRASRISGSNNLAVQQQTNGDVDSNARGTHGLANGDVSTGLNETVVNVTMPPATTGPSV